MAEELPKDIAMKEHRTVYISGPRTSAAVDAAIVVDRCETEFLRSLTRSSISQNQHQSLTNELQELVDQFNKDVRRVRNKGRSMANRRPSNRRNRGSSGNGQGGNATGADQSGSASGSGAAASGGDAGAAVSGS